MGSRLPSGRTDPAFRNMPCRGPTVEIETRNRKPSNPVGPSPTGLLHEVPGSLFRGSLQICWTSRLSVYTPRR